MTHSVCSFCHSVCWNTHAITFILQINFGLFLWLYRGYQQIVRILSSHPDCDLNRPNKHGQTPLCTAVREGHVEVVKTLVSAGSDLEWSDTERKSPLIAGVERSQEGTAKVLIESGNWRKGTDRVEWVQERYLFSKLRTHRTLMELGQ